MTRIKICGLKRPEDIDAVNAAGPDYCGFVIEVDKSPRSVTREQVKKLVSHLSAEVVPVGVFVNAPITLPAQLLAEGTIAAAQLHGDEDEHYIMQLRQLTERPILQAFSVRCAEDVKRALHSSADYILLDQGGGGTGTPFDWSLALRIERPFFLAGGLGLHNLQAAMKTLRPWAVDLSSSLETEGVKSRERILEAVSLVRNTDHLLEKEQEQNRRKQHV